MCIMGKTFITRNVFFSSKNQYIMENTLRSQSIFHNYTSIQKYMHNESNNEIMAMKCSNLWDVSCTCTIKYSCWKLLLILLICFIDTYEKIFYFFLE